MPCVGYEPYFEEVELERMKPLLDELGLTPSTPPRSNTGWPLMDKYHEATRTLCEHLKTLDPSYIKELSLDVQIWWRDHQRVDAQREAAEKEKQEEKKVKAQALAKLTEAEKRALGIR